MLPEQLNFNHLSCRAIEIAGNRALQLDCQSNDGLRQFANKVIHVQITDWTLDYYFLFPNSTLVVRSKSVRSPSVSISGKLSAFIAAATQKNSGDAIFQGDLHFTGEINTARQFQQFVQQLQIDWQQPLSDSFGDVAGQLISNGLIKTGSFVKNVFVNIQQDTPEYLQEELKVTPSHTELEQFFDQVDLVRSQAERLQARILRLQNND